MINDKKSKHLKLPQIGTKTADSFNEEKPKRPLSSTKVQHLSNKLFNELQQYDMMSKKINSKIKSKRKLQTSIQQSEPKVEMPQKYQKFLKTNENSKHELNTTQEKKTEKKDSFAVAERQIQEIYEQYLREEGLSTAKQTTSEDLKQMSKQIQKTEQEIEGLKFSMFEMIRKFGNDCLTLD